MKKIISFTMCLILGVSLLAGCNAKKPVDKPDTEVTNPDGNQGSEGTTTPDAVETPDSETTPDAIETPDEDNSEVTTPDANQKVKVNISGTIEEISEDNSKIKVDGKWITITDDTRFETDPDNGTEAVSKEFKVGNKIAGFTSDENADEIIAEAIYSNTSEK